MSIIAVGSIAFDTIRTTEGKRERILGGALTHFSNAAAQLSRPKLVGVVGHDFGIAEWDFLQSRASDVSGVVSLAEEKCFFWEGYYTEDFDTAHTVTTELNAFSRFNPVVPPYYLKTGDLLFLANIDPVIQKKVADQCVSCRLKMLDTMNFWIETKRDALEEAFGAVDGIVINEGEAFLLTGEKNLLKAVDRLFKPHYQMVILKKGSNGVMVFGKDFTVSLPAFPLKKIVDPTGAGDSFAGAFMSYIDSKRAVKLERELVKQAAAYATVMASFCVEDFGVAGIQNADRGQIKKRFTEYRKIASF